MFSNPRKASTVIILRKLSGFHCDQFEVLMVLKSPNSKFVPSHYVFPGGSVDSNDLSPQMEDHCSGITARQAMKIIPNASRPEEALAFWVAAIRETFEETGILFAYDKDNSIISLNDSRKKKLIEEYRKHINNNNISFFEFVEKENLVLAADRLKFFSRWITPALSPIRYDTHFFIAQAPDKQSAMHDGSELTGHLWITPADALGRFNTRNFNMALPTVKTLEQLGIFKSIDEAAGLVDMAS
jgi:8-oxo-dGTP pyrophosphatase MutT (NUDIX family)